MRAPPEDDRDLLDGEPLEQRPVGQLHLEGVALRAQVRRHDGGERVRPPAADAAGEVADSASSTRRAYVHPARDGAPQRAPALDAAARHVGSR